MKSIFSDNIFQAVSDIRNQLRNPILAGLTQLPSSWRKIGCKWHKSSCEIVRTPAGDGSKGSFVDYSADNVRNNIST